MLRNCIAIMAAALLYVGLNIGGTDLMAFLVFRTAGGLNEQQLLMRLTLWETLVVGPAVAVIVGATFASIAQRRFWWLAGAAFLPLLIFGLFINIHDVGTLDFVVCIAHVTLACLAAFIISRLKQPHTI